MGNENFPTKEAAAYIAARAAFFEYMDVRINIGRICPESFFESWIKSHVFKAEEDFEEAIFADCMKLLSNYRDRGKK